MWNRFLTSLAQSLRSVLRLCGLYQNQPQDLEAPITLVTLARPASGPPLPATAESLHVSAANIVWKEYAGVELMAATSTAETMRPPLRPASSGSSMPSPSGRLTPSRPLPSPPPSPMLSESSSAPLLPQVSPIPSDAASPANGSQDFAYQRLFNISTSDSSGIEMDD